MANVCISKRSKSTLRVLQFVFCVLQFALTRPLCSQDNAGNSLEAREEAALKTAVETVAPSVVQIRTIGGLDAEAIIAATRRDKKVVAGTLHFVLPTRIGETTIATDVDETQVRESLAAIGISGQ